ncbi:glycosyltransferase family 2 protein [Erwinia sp. MMLR14_017]|uniref:glycosyltransferase family 2 protein n=1 Tax=Erwinia sp. MMLR14_017 TaxID=3093842 RepID=UPI00298FF78A|nr:glycosyltransferase family 2 protein [Erwinia sp. MMLR14_017]MDW8847218.1 glycosyltransferase family 2 protein [Erwinia sp. MMLR14_017]
MNDSCISGRKVFISVVSHGHSVMLKELDSLAKLAEVFHVVVKNNTQDSEIVSYCDENNIHLIDSDYNKGFGFNNNIVYNFCCSELGMSCKDFFLVVNPDVFISKDEIMKLIISMHESDICAATINLFKDADFSISDDSIRNFPTLMDFIKSFTLGINKTKINKNTIDQKKKIDWCAGSFMAFTASTFGKLKGFDINYFMYCEDVDICYRLKKEDLPLIYFPDVRGLHIAKHNNRKVFSRHFWWHLKSVIIFTMARNGFLKPKSNIV